MTMHGGKVHAVTSKAELAEHIGREHVGPDGRYRSTAYPPVAERRRWRRDELEQAHADLHGTDAAWDAQFAATRAAVR
jgi:hypothetical protein